MNEKFIAHSAINSTSVRRKERYHETLQFIAKINAAFTETKITDTSVKTLAGNKINNTLDYKQPQNCSLCTNLVLRIAR